MLKSPVAELTLNAKVALIGQNADMQAQQMAIEQAEADAKANSS